MKHLLPLLLVVVIASACKFTGDNGASDVVFYGKDNVSAEMEFDNYLLVSMPEGVSDPKEMLSKPELRRQVEYQITWQLKHMFGAFTEHDEYRNNPGIPYRRSKMDITGIEASEAEGFARVNYTYSDKVVFKKAFLKEGKKEIKFWLPKEVQGIYAKGCPNGKTTSSIRGSTYCESGQEANTCTDHHYNSMGDFWYFWSPDRYGCTIDTEKDLIRVKAVVDPIPSTTKTYPYYDTIYGDNGNGEILDIVYLVGVDENFRSGDLGRQTFEESIEGLEKFGFTIDTGASSERLKVMNYQTSEFSAVLTAVLVDPGSPQFTKLAMEGLQNADVFIYDGHSGLGGYLNVDRFRGLKLPTNKSQIMYFNGCSTYSYYNADYFDLKKTTGDPEGRKSLDVITTSIGASFAVGATHDLALITSLVNQKRPSWQDIMDQIYDAAPSLTALTHVNGDEDNPNTFGNRPEGDPTIFRPIDLDATIKDDKLFCTFSNGKEYQVNQLWVQGNRQKVMVQYELTYAPIFRFNNSPKHYPAPGTLAPYWNTLASNRKLSRESLKKLFNEVIAPLSNGRWKITGCVLK